ncbi:hypothetical protein VNO77_19739 [Canavalia gladiata]|uniref:Uncharacterized protein n=1 Tax=Canavalia gladiata TaxID=3824 RepID=A0AAN9QLQ7_CANGL
MRSLVHSSYLGSIARGKSWRPCCLSSKSSLSSWQLFERTASTAQELWTAAGLCNRVARESILRGKITSLASGSDVFLVSYSEGLGTIDYNDPYQIKPLVSVVALRARGVPDQFFSVCDIKSGIVNAQALPSWITSVMRPLSLNIREAKVKFGSNPILGKTPVRVKLS